MGGREESMRVRAWSRDVMGRIARMGTVSLGGRRNGRDEGERVMMAPRSDWDIMVRLWDLAREERVDGIGDVAGDFFVSGEVVRKRIECARTCWRKSFWMNSLTRMRSGA